MGYKYKTNHTYFDKIDSEEKAYLLGLIYSDGTISPKDGNRQHRITIALQEEDGYIFDNFSELTSKPPDYRYPPSYKKKGWKPQASFRVTSNNIGETLIKYGCNINKSRVGMDFPTKFIPEKYMNHFIRGFMDGDGSIIIKKRNYKYIRKTKHFLKNAHTENKDYMLKLAFCSTDLEFLKELGKILNVKLYIRSKLRKQMVYTAWIERKDEVQKVLKYIYKDATVYFKRKYNKIEEFNMLIKSPAIDTSIEGLETT